MADEDGTNTTDPKDERIHALELQIAELSGKLSVTPTKTEDPPAKEWTRAELDAQVSAGNITESQRDDVLDRQRDQRLAREVDKRVAEKVDQNTLTARLDTELGEYEVLKPDVLKAGSADRKKVEDEFNYLLSIGQPKTKATELAALRAVFGPVSRLKAAVAAGEGRRETHQETGSGGGGTESSNTRADGSPKGLDARTRAYYQKGIDSGRYADWAAVEAERNFQPKKRA